MSISKNRQIARGDGRRNVYCPEYRGCLDSAIGAGMRAFNCEICPSFVYGPGRAQDVGPDKPAAEVKYEAIGQEEREMETWEEARKTKVCKKCGEEKDLENDFGKHPGFKDGWDSTCKECRNEAARERHRKKKKTKTPKKKRPRAGKNKAAKQKSAVKGNVWRADKAKGVVEELFAIELLEKHNPGMLALRENPVRLNEKKLGLLREVMAYFDGMEARAL